jgi:uncharacterized protein with PIN domain
MKAKEARRIVLTRDRELLKMPRDHPRRLRARSSPKREQVSQLHDNFVRCPGCDGLSPWFCRRSALSKVE